MRYLQNPSKPLLISILDFLSYLISLDTVIYAYLSTPIVIVIGFSH